jgi:glycine betaine transporter
VLAPSLAAFVWFSVFGGAALHLEILQHVDIATAARADPSTALFALFDALPLTQLLSVAATVLVLVFFVTSGDSAVLVLSMMSSRGDPNPAPRIKVMWGLLVAGIATALLLSGGLNAVQTATIVFALPFTVVIVLMTLALWRGVREDWHEAQREERRIRQGLRQMLADHPGPRDRDESMH